MLHSVFNKKYPEKLRKNVTNQITRIKIINSTEIHKYFPRELVI